MLDAMGVEPDIAANTIRVSLGWNTTRAEVERFAETWLGMARP
jgi:cysteine desulfurase